jgi:hypothetical protein
MTTTNVHGSEVRDGMTYCTDCGAQLTVGGYESYQHRNHLTGARGECPRNIAARRFVNRGGNLRNDHEGP